MKKRYLLLILLFALTFSCTDENDTMNEGIITGIDVRECSCCGGFFVEIKDSTYRFYSLPTGSNINLTNNPGFPIYVNLNWKMRDTLCLGDEIIVLKIEPR